MNKILAAASAAGLMVIATSASAQTVEGSIGYSSAEFGNVDLGAVTGRIGWNSANIFGIEGEASFGVNDDRTTLAGPPPVTTDIELKYAVAVYGTAGLPIGENGRVFARVGYGTQELEAKAPGVVGIGTEDSVNYGVGAQYFFDGANGIRADWTRHDFDAGDSDVWSVSYVRRFR